MMCESNGLFDAGVGAPSGMKDGPSSPPSSHSHGPSDEAAHERRVWIVPTVDASLVSNTATSPSHTL